MQGLFDLSAHNSAPRPQVEELLGAAGRNGTPAMRARSRKLLGRMAKEKAGRTRSPKIKGK